jgi:hypothetical protein
MMTRKDYVKTAEILNKFFENLPDFPGIENNVFDLVADFSDWFLEDNPNFSANKFELAVYGE